MTAPAMRTRRRLTVPLGLSVLLHAAAVVGFIALARTGVKEASATVYRVQLVAAPAGVRAAGVVNPAREAPPETKTPARAKEKAPPPSTKRAAPTRTTRATATPPRKSTAADRAPVQPKAGGGAQGGKGTDVATVNLDGKEFPFPAYLENIVNSVMKYFTGTWSEAYRAEVSFMIRKDGSVAGIQLGQATASLEFKMAAYGAVEAAGKHRAFGPLPAGFDDDVLPIVFSFDPRIIR